MGVLRVTQSDVVGEETRPDRASGGGAPSAKSANPASTWIALAVALNLAVGMAYSVFSLRRDADALRSAVLDVARLSEQSSRVDALAWEAIAKDGERATLAGDVRRTVALRQQALRELRRDGEIDDLSSIEAAVGRHQAVIDDVLALSAAGRNKQARALEDTRAKPALEGLQRVANRVGESYERAAAGSARTADIESVVMVLLGAATAVLLFRRFAWAQRAGELKAARERAQSEGRFRTLVENASDVITVIDAKGAIRYQSPSLQRMLGYSPDELLGQTLSVLVHPEDMKEGSILGSEMVAVGAVRRVRCRFRHADGTYRFVENVCTNLLDNTDVAGIVVNTLDVTPEKAWESALRDSEGMFRNVAESANDAIVSADEDGAIVFWNKGAEKMFGYTQGDALGQCLTILIPERYRSAHTAGVMRRRSGEPSRIMGQSLELEGLRKDGEEFPLELSLAGWQTGDQAFSTGIMRDISERRKAQEMLREREEQLRYHVEHVPAVVYRSEIGAEGRWLYVSPQIETLLGFSPEEWKADPRLWIQRVHPDDRDACMSEEGAVLHTVDDKPVATEYRMITRDGRTIWVIDDAAIVRDAHGVPLYWSGVLYDITDRKLLEQQLEQQAFSDSLTGLANRALFLDRVEHALARGRRDEEPATVMFLDLDDFKNVNDSLGHEAGDQLLMTVGARLRSCLRPADTIARLGGDEFAVLLESTSAEVATPLAWRVLEVVGEPYCAEGRALVVRASIGIETGAGSTHSASELLRNADVAMYVAKGGGKARVAVFDPGMHTAALKRLEMKGDLQRAITEQELVLYYQPVVALVDGTILGVEALARWRHPQHGMVPPADFIPVAEDTGLIIPLGKWVLAEACRQAAQWQTESPRSPALGMSVNVSTVQLFHGGLVEEVAAALEDSGLEPQSLTLEITESGLMEDKEAAISRLKELRQLGVRVAVDDFGTGYSSLAYLSTLPIDVLKIDKVFIDGVARGPEDSAIAGAVGKLANALGLVLVAEGIEFEEQVEALLAMEFERGQGYYYSRPLPASEILSLPGL